MPHTPGPWCILPHTAPKFPGAQHIIYDAADQMPVAMIPCDIRPQDASANAALFLAAPELLEMAERALASLDAIESGYRRAFGFSDPKPGSLVYDLRSAITKAKGEV